MLRAHPSEAPFWYRLLVFWSSIVGWARARTRFRFSQFCTQSRLARGGRACVPSARQVVSSLGAIDWSPPRNRAQLASLQQMSGRIPRRAISEQFPCWSPRLPLHQADCASRRCGFSSEACVCVVRYYQYHETFHLNPALDFPSKIGLLLAGTRRCSR